MNERQVPTPSMLRKARRDALGLPGKGEQVTRWSYGMVKDTLFNDFHNGVLRLHKRERMTINGRDQKSPGTAICFSRASSKIFDDATMELLLRRRQTEPA